ncbi:RIP metalloprotease RseP [Desulfovibrio litoralis]|uniref:Zinc metalloprotease n=1 Tax=Desulfovibrio litoralis DSM 11393 TaxID=1121455 RepID=A0A1M7SH41_9BACT|nr:RIP metalloprotease RseP [Desulfovibrio litoralis]SHN57808.1 regulator of sigma E protease [Desulfovibrio litoralis DSM 11393]
MLGTLAVVLVFGGLIFVHELGHFFFARLFGMGVKTFSLGFGPVLFSFKRGKTVYQLAALPFGGFCSLVGEEKVEDLPEPFTLEESFSLRPAWQRFFVVLGGALFNLILAWLICWSIAYTSGRPVMLPEVGRTMENSAAQVAGLKSGDKIINIDGIVIERWEQIPELIQNGGGKEVKVEVKRPDMSESLFFQLTPTRKTVKDIFGDDKELWLLGIEPSQNRIYIPLGFIDSAKEGIIQAYKMIDITIQFLQRLFSGRGNVEEVGSVVSIARVIHAQTEYGITNVLFIAALISVNLGVINLLPIPVLDGGTLVFLTIEMIFRKPLPESFRYRASVVGMAILISLTIILMVKDIFVWVRDVWF